MRYGLIVNDNMGFGIDFRIYKTLEAAQKALRDGYEQYVKEWDVKEINDEYDFDTGCGYIEERYARAMNWHCEMVEWSIVEIPNDTE